MSEFFWFMQFVLIVVILWKLWGIGKSLGRVESEQERARRQSNLLRAVVEKLSGSKKSGGDAADKQVADKPVAASDCTFVAEMIDAFEKKNAEKSTSAPSAVSSSDVSEPVLRTVPPPLPVSVAKPPSEKVALPAVKEVEESPIVANAREMLGRIWSWILVGEEHRSEKMSMEYAIASTWLVRMSIVIFVACVAYFLKWSMERNLLGPTARVAISILFGVGMIISGLRLLGKKYHLIGQGLLGGGILIMYFSVYAAGPLYSLISTPLAFGLMIIVTTAAWLIAIRVNSMLVAILGIAGGFITPVLLSTGAANLPVLYSYMLLLNLGILAVSHSRHWSLLNFLGFVMTYVIFIGSLQEYKQSDFTITIAFLSAVFVIHSVIVYLYNIRKRKPSNALEIIHLVANGCIYGGIAYWLISDAHGRPYPAIMSISMAAFYVSHVVLFLRRKLKDRGLLVALIALAGAYTVWTLPLLFEKESLTIGFALLAVTFLWIGKRIGSRFIENLSHLIYAVVFVRLIGEMEYDFNGLAVADSAAEYWHAMFDRLWTFGVAIGSIGAAFYMEKRQQVKDPIVSEASDTVRFVPASAGKQIFFWGTVAFLFFYLHLEINAMFGMWDMFRLPALTVLWCCMGLYFLYMLCRSQVQNGALLIALAVFAAGSLVKVLSMDLAAWNMCEGGYYDMAYTGGAVLARMVDFGSVMMLFAFVASRIHSFKSPKYAGSIFGYGLLGILFLYTTLEINTLLHWYVPGFQNGGVTVLWSVFAIAFTGSGIWRNIRTLRFLGLGLFVVVAGKVFLHDLNHMPMIFRVIAFFVIGVALMLGAFAYIFAGKKFEIEGDGD